MSSYENCFFGTPQFAARVLDYLLRHQINVVAVVSKPDRSKGRSGTPVATPVKEVALGHSIPIYQPEIVSDLAFASVLEAYQADLLSSWLMARSLNNIYSICLSVAVSIYMPVYCQNTAAQPYSTLNDGGRARNRVTIMHMVRKMDAGDMIETVQVPIDPEMTFGELEEEMCRVGEEALLRVIQSFEVSEPSRTPQDHTQATLAPKIELEECQVMWTSSAEEIHNLVRASILIQGHGASFVSMGK